MKLNDYGITLLCNQKKYQRIEDIPISELQTNQTKLIFQNQTKTIITHQTKNVLFTHLAKINSYSTLDRNKKYNKNPHKIIAEHIAVFTKDIPLQNYLINYLK